MHKKAIFLISGLITGITGQMFLLIAQQSSYGGSVWQIPGIIESENYDSGGEWLEYTVSIVSAGNYIVTFNYAAETTGFNGGKCNFSIGAGDNTVSGSFDTTASWIVFVQADTDPIAL